jgi:ABC-type molybdenum transport system ATPase subunit/photorepair protein PhrA
MSKSVEKHQDLTELFDAEQFSHHLAETDKPVILFREAIQNASTILDERYRQNKNILDIVISGLMRQI